VLYSNLVWCMILFFAARFSLFWILGAGVQFGLVNDFVFLDALSLSQGT